LRKSPLKLPEPFICRREFVGMVFVLVSLTIAAAFFVTSLILLNYGRYLGLRYLRQNESANMAGLATVEGAVFIVIGLLLAFTISGALQRFDERRQLVIQEANAAGSTYDRLDLFEGEVALALQAKLKNYPCSKRALSDAARFLAVGSG
jgi:hypothetical protein